jgi:signal transduction histidine kinase
MSIKLRLAFLLGLLLLVFFFSLAAMRAMERKQFEETLASARREEVELLARWLELGAAPLRRFVEDMSQWPDLSLAPADQDAQAYLNSAREHAGLDAAWLISTDGSVRHSSGNLTRLSLDSPLEAGLMLPSDARAGRHYFIRRNSKLLEIRGHRHVSGAWIFAARLWDEDHLNHLGGLADGQASLLPPDTTAPESAHSNTLATILVTRPLLDWQGRPLGLLRLEKNAPEITFQAEADSLKTKIFFGFGVCLIGSLALSLHSWVLRPLGWITESLARQDTAPITPLLAQNNELTRVARLIQSSFEHREQLRREIAERRHAETELQRTLQERARLGRDLHDSVIQSIYAAGMGLVAARKLTAANPAEAEARLAQVGDLLNDTIRDVRDFITGLEPESLAKASFADTVDRLFAGMNPAGTARIELDLDEDVVLRLDPSLRTELLLVLREAISNALRHGHARLLEIALLPVGRDRARLQVADDGSGFDPSSARRGRGLDNLQTRASLRSARLDLDSRPGDGTRLTMEFALPDETIPEASLHAA